MSRQIHLARDGTIIGAWPQEEVAELVKTGFAKPADEFWTEGMKDWQPLSELEPVTARLAAAPTRPTLDVVAALAGVLAKRAAVAGRRLIASMETRKAATAMASQRVLEDYLPHLRLLAAQKLAKAAAVARSTFDDDQAARKLFGALYDCLPRPVRRFVSEPEFIEFCCKHRSGLLSGDAPIESGHASASDPKQESSRCEGGACY